VKACSKCAEDKQESEFHRQQKRGQLYVYPYCKDCHRKIMRAHYDANREDYLRKADRWRQVALNAARDHIRNYLLTHPCADCGEADLVVLQFDHCRGKKINNISAMVRRGAKLATIKNEISKCDVVCANCHTRRTAARGGWWSLALVAQRIEQRSTEPQVGSSSLSEGAA
jgi:hypothetical protein